MLKHIAAISFIFVVTSLAWMILGTTIYARTDSFGGKLKEGVVSVWGEQQTQMPPVVSFDVAQKSMEQTIVDGKPVTRIQTTHSLHYLSAEASDVDVNLGLDYRQKGLLWYSTYNVDFGGTYAFRNTDAAAQNVTFELKLPAEHAIYDGLAIEINGKQAEFSSGANSVLTTANLAPNQKVQLHVAYRSHGLENWTYKMAEGVTEWRNFRLSMKTNFKDIDFPSNTLSPTAKQEAGDGWNLAWQYKDLISGFAIGMVMPEKLQPGPLAAEISYFAPVSLLLFFFVLFIVTSLRNIEVHPMNYFFLAAAFFAFHLLLAYLVDRISVHLAFVICSAVSIFLVISYLRLVVGPRFAMVEAGLAQFVYLVLFSYSFFLKGFTGLAVTLGCIVTLFLTMQMTGGIRWKERFSGAGAPLAP